MGRAGQLLLGWYVVFMAIAILSNTIGHSVIWWVTVGIRVALFIAGILLVLEKRVSAPRQTWSPAVNGQ